MITNSCSPYFELHNYHVPESGKERFAWLTTLAVAIISGILLGVTIALYGFSISALPPACVAVISSLFLLVFSYNPPLEDAGATSSSNNAEDELSGDGANERRYQTRPFNHTETLVFPRPNREIGEGLLSLPNETLIHVFSFLPAFDLNRIRKVCTTFKDCADNEALWECRAKTINNNLGKKLVLFGTQDRVTQIDDSWRKGWVIAQGQGLISVVESNYFSITGGVFYYYSSTGNLCSCPCDGDYKRIQHPLTLTGSPDSKWTFAMKEGGGIACDGRNLFRFTLDCPEVKPIDFIYNEEASITAMCLSENDQLLIGTEKGALQLYEKIDQSYEFKMNLDAIKTTDAIVSIRSKGMWIAFMTVSPGKDHQIQLLNTDTLSFGEFSLHQKDETCCFALSEEYLVVGNDDRITICDLKFEGKSISTTAYIYSGAEIHALEIQGDHLSVAYSKNEVGIDEDGTTHWIRPRGLAYDFGPNKYISLNLYNFSLTPLTSALSH